jgi:hypothetical protein
MLQFLLYVKFRFFTSNYVHFLKCLNDINPKIQFYFLKAFNTTFWGASVDKHLKWPAYSDGAPRNSLPVSVPLPNTDSKAQVEMLLDVIAMFSYCLMFLDVHTLRINTSRENKPMLGTWPSGHEDEVKRGALSRSSLDEAQGPYW